MMFPFQGNSVSSLPEFKQDLATFLLTRGTHAYLGHAWKGCSQQYFFPAALNADYGEPTDTVCKETGEDSGIFTREWSKASVKMDCASYTGEITMKNNGRSVFDL